MLFDHGLSPLDPGSPEEWTNTWCGSCHSQAYGQWTESRHFIAGINDNFRKECLADGGRLQFCVNCHAPLNPGGNLLPTAEPPLLEQAYETHEEWLTSGVDCITCHVRDGEVLVTRKTPEAEKAHPIRLAPELGTAEFCVSCHQFAFKSEFFPDGFEGKLQQASLDEFFDFRAAGGSETRCHDCHMPDGDHRMPGGYSHDMLQTALELDLSAEWQPVSQTVLVSATVSAGHVGHRVPGGEHFRFLTLHTTPTDSQGIIVVGSQRNVREPDRVANDAELATSWPQVETMRRVLTGTEEDSAAGSAVPDTRIWPGEDRRFDYRMAVDPGRIKLPLRARAELWYHFMDATKAKLVGRTPEDVKRLVLSEEISVEPNAEP